MKSVNDTDSNGSVRYSIVPSRTIQACPRVKAAPAVLDRLNSLLEPDGFLLPGSQEISTSDPNTASSLRLSLEAHRVR